MKFGLIGAGAPQTMKCVLGLAGLLMVTGCTAPENRRLLITEVGERRVELFLNESSGETMRLGDGLKMTMRSNENGTLKVQSMGLGAGDQLIPAGGYFVIWEESNYSGPPVAAPFPGGQTGAVPGIKVSSSFFLKIRDYPSEIRIHGAQTFGRFAGFLFLFTEHRIDDVVRFGQPDSDRPASGGTFNGDGSLGGASDHLTNQRRWSNGAPVDTNAEADWKNGPSSWGVATP